VLLSEVTAGLAREHLPDGTSLRDLGAHRLKDLLEAERILQLGHPALEESFPALKTLNTRLHNLPCSRRPFRAGSGTSQSSVRCSNGMMAALSP
jgi:hypothetical protein